MLDVPGPALASLELATASDNAMQQLMIVLTCKAWGSIEWNEAATTGRHLLKPLEPEKPIGASHDLEHGLVTAPPKEPSEHLLYNANHPGWYSLYARVSKYSCAPAKQHQTSHEHSSTRTISRQCTKPQLQCVSGWLTGCKPPE